MRQATTCDLTLREYGRSGPLLGAESGHAARRRMASAFLYNHPRRLRRATCCLSSKMSGRWPASRPQFWYYTTFKAYINGKSSEVGCNNLYKTHYLTERSFNSLQSAMWVALPTSAEREPGEKWSGRGGWMCPPSSERPQGRPESRLYPRPTINAACPLTKREINHSQLMAA